MPEFAVKERNKVRRGPHRADYDRDTVYAIIDEALYCHVGFVQDGQPYVIPSNHGRDGRPHASARLRRQPHAQRRRVRRTALRHLYAAGRAGAGAQVFHHSVNYRSAVIFGAGELIDDPAEKLAALETITEHIMPGRWADARQPSEKELAATSVVSVAIESASAKVRTGPPGDDKDDYALPVWAGVLPMRSEFLAPQPDPAAA